MKSWELIFRNWWLCYHAVLVFRSHTLKLPETKSHLQLTLGTKRKRKGKKENIFWQCKIFATHESRWGIWDFILIFRNFVIGFPFYDFTPTQIEEGKSRKMSLYLKSGLAHQSQGPVLDPTLRKTVKYGPRFSTRKFILVFLQLFHKLSFSK